MTDPLNKVDEKAIEEYNRLHHFVRIVFDYQLKGDVPDYNDAKANWLSLLECENKAALAAALTDKLNEIASDLSAMKTLKAALRTLAR